MVIGHVLPEKNESLLEAYEKCRSSADAKTCCDYALHVGVTWWGPRVWHPSTVPLMIRSDFLIHILKSTHSWDVVFFILVRNVKLCTCHCEMFILPAGAGRDGEAGERGRSQLLPDVHGL